MKKKKAHRIITTILSVILIIYLAMLVNTNSLMRYVRDVFLWRVDSAETIGRPINRYNDSNRLATVELGEVKLTLIRMFTLHNFRDGYIWAYYSYEAHDTDGEIITGSWRIPTKWKIHKENGVWKIVEIIEAP